MLSGELYNAADEELKEERAQAREVVHRYNQLMPSQADERMALIRGLLGSVGDSFNIGQGFHCDYGYNIHIGRNFYCNVNCVFLDTATIRIGDDAFLGPNVGLYAAEHPTDVETRNKAIEYANPITIGDNVWIGGNTVVLGGVTIGNNSVIGAGSVVTRDIPDNVIAVGNPCKVVKQIG